MNDTQAFEDAGLAGLFDMSFKRFITLSVIKVLFILGIVLIALMWAAMVISGFTQGVLPGMMMLVIGSVGALLYIIFFRVWLELIVIIFRIAENTSMLVEQNRGGSSRPAMPMPPHPPINP